MMEFLQLAIGLNGGRLKVQVKGFGSDRIADHVMIKADAVGGVFEIDSGVACVPWAQITEICIGNSDLDFTSA